MCLRIRLTDKEKKEAIKKLPKVFPVWKILNPTGFTEYYDEGNEECFTKKGIYKAKFYSRYRSSLAYKSGFHAFLSRATATIAMANHCNRKIAKFWAKREWVQEIGNFNRSYRWQKGVVLSHIETKNKKTN